MSAQSSKLKAQSIKIIIAGSGGQGVMLSGKILAMSAMKEAKSVTWLPAYGAEVRGGAAHCSVIISQGDIGSPYIKKADALLIMNQASFLKFRIRCKKDSLLILNSSLVDAKVLNSEEALCFPFTEIAIRLGNIKTTNVVMLGVFVAKTKIVSPKTVLEVIFEMAPSGRKDLFDINQRAFREGMSLTKGLSKI